MLAKATDSNDGHGKLLSNPRFAPLKQDQFNPAEFTSRVLAGSHTTAQAKSEELKESVRLLKNELSEQVVSKHVQLLSTARKVVDTEASVQEVVSSLAAIQLAVKRIRAELVGPYDHIKAQNQKLRNLHAAVDLLRHLLYRLKLTQKLKAQLDQQPGAIDLAKAAKILTDIHAIGVDFSGIELASADDEYLDSARVSIRSQAEAALTEGMNTLSQAKVGSALQVFFNLEELQQVVQSLMTSYLHELERALKSALDSRQLGVSAASGGGLLGGTAAGRIGGQGVSGGLKDKLWKGLKDAGEVFMSRAVAVWHLQRVVAKKRDPHSHVLFQDVLMKGEQASLVQQFWDGCVKVLTEHLAAVARPSKGGQVREALISSCPQLVSLLESWFNRLQSDTTIKGVVPAVVPEQLQQLLGATGPFQGQYLSACLSRMNEGVNAAFAGAPRSVPSPADVQACIGCMHEELKTATSSMHMAGVVAAAVGQAVVLFAEKAEFMAVTGPEVRSLGPICNTAQARNITLCSQLQEVQRSLTGLLSRLPPSVGSSLQKPFDRLQDTIVEVVAPLLKAAVERFEEMILKLHTYDWGKEDDSGAGEGGAAVTETSQYMMELTQAISQFRQEYLSKFTPLPSPTTPSCVGSLVQRMSSRLLVFFVRHAALVRPLSQQGRLQVAKDMGELQQAVMQALYPLEHSAVPLKILRSFRALLFMDASSVLSSQVLTELPLGVIAHQLFSRLPTSIPTPHQRSSLTPVQYSRWLDTHSSADVTASVVSALEAVEEGKLKGHEELCDVIRKLAARG